MSNIERQVTLTTRLENLRAERSRIDREITKAATELHAFEKEFGNLVLKEKNRKTWLEKQPELEAIRSTPEFQEWREKFMASKNNVPTSNHVKEPLIFTMNDGPTMAHVMHKAGLFKSVGDARKNGWNIGISKGTFVVGKNKTLIKVV